MSDKERALLLEAIARHAVHVRECIEACERDVPGLPPPAPGAIATYRDDLTMLDRMYAKLAAGAAGDYQITLRADPEHGKTYEELAAEGRAPSDPAVLERLVDQMRKHEIEKLAGAIRAQVAKFSDRRLNDGDDVWRERELEYRCAVAQTANAVCVALQLDPPTFAAACGLYVSDGRDSYSDCYPGELTWEQPLAPEVRS